MRKHFWSIWLILLFTSGSLLAQNSTFNKDSVFTWGMNEFANGNVEVALQHFETYFENVTDSTTAQYADVINNTNLLSII